MCEPINYGKYDGYAKISSRTKQHGNECQPCHSLIPPQVEAPPIIIIDGPEITLYGSASNDRPSWYLIWLFGLLIGMSIGLLIAKSL